MNRVDCRNGSYACFTYKYLILCRASPHHHYNISRKTSSAGHRAPPRLAIQRNRHRANVPYQIPGVLVTGQVQDWQTEDKSEEEHPEPCIRGDPQLRAAAGLAVRADTVAQRVARRHVRPERLPGGGDATAGRRRFRRRRAHVVQVA